MFVRPPPAALLTDLYQLTMADGYWKSGTHNKEAVFHLFFRKNPFQSGFSIHCGLRDVIESLNNFAFDETGHIAVTREHLSSFGAGSIFRRYWATAR